MENQIEIYKSSDNNLELDEDATCAKFAQVRKEGKSEVLHYNLDVIISAGYLANNKSIAQWKIKLKYTSLQIMQLSFK